MFITNSQGKNKIFLHSIPNGFGDAGFLGFSFGCIAVLCSTPVAGSTEGEQRADKTTKDGDSETGRFRSVGYIQRDYFPLRRSF